MPRREGTPVRVVLVAGATGDAVGTASAAVQRLLGGAPRCLLTAPGEDSVETAADIGDALGADPVVDAAWSGSGDVADVWDRVVARGGTTVVVCSADTVRAVLGHVLGMPAARLGRLAVAPGSLAGVEVWSEDDVSVAFTNRS